MPAKVLLIRDAIRISAIFLTWSWMAAGQSGAPERPLHICIAGLVHGHVDGFLRSATKRPDVQIAGIFDPDAALRQMYAQRFGLPDTIFYADLATMLDRVKPEAVALFTNTYDHPVAVAACAARHIDVMMEKPLAVSMAHAHAIEQAARRGGIQVIVNYETTWYRSHGALWHIVKEQHAAGEIRKMVAMDGHQGPREIHVGPEFLGWLIDPVKNGAGALFDFGCYGANLMTWMMDNQRPLAVTALTQTIAPDEYSKVDDQATVLISYPKAQGIIQASWRWPFNRKDFEVYGEHGYGIATGGDSLRVRLDNSGETSPALDALPADERDSISYLTAVARGRLKPGGLSSLENNMIVTEILAAARESARSGRTVTLETGPGK
jgi:predicted dehydrogenase